MPQRDLDARAVEARVAALEKREKQLAAELRDHERRLQTLERAAGALARRVAAIHDAIVTATNSARAERKAKRAKRAKQAAGGTPG